MTKLFKETMTDEVFSWNAASNNQGLVAGQLSYILNSISAWRTAQDANPAVADDVLFVPALKGPAGQLAAQHVMYNWIVPSFANNVDAAKEFLLHYTANMAAVTYASKLYDFPASCDSLTPDLDGWMENDPFGAKPAEQARAYSTTPSTGAPTSATPARPTPPSARSSAPSSSRTCSPGWPGASCPPRSPWPRPTKQCEAVFDKWRSRGSWADRPDDRITDRTNQRSTPPWP